jgi:hypothetical protein
METIRVLVRETLAVLQEQDAQKEYEQKANKNQQTAQVVA